jgi:mannitol/fructose-specific phosphotransferase system IIA component (Ntr-type)
MLISPSGKPDEHLRNLALIARSVGTNAKRTDLLKAETAEALFEALASS